MSSDRARISYDEKQQYRSVVTQQGRVSLESDWNEQGQIVGEEIRKEALDFVGPSGAPGDGYALAKGGGAGTFDLSLSPGALYIGGLRVSLDQALNYGNQPDWLDNGIDPDWVAVPSTTPATKEYVYLLLREQEVSAVEDSALREVALGGPDSAARTRLVQRIVRTPTAQADCPSALNDLLKNHWQQQGLAFDFTTMRLASKATLTLAFDTAKTSSDPCQPQSAGGYLGAENQLIQVKICYADNTKKTYKLLWGYDNASYLYRVSDLSSNQQLLLNTQPVDSFHQPAKNQAVEVLLAAAQLPNGEYVATDHGFATLLSANYDPNLQAVALTDPLPAGYPQNHASYLNSPPIFLRVWQEEISFVPGTSVPLGGTGLNVTLNADPNGLFHIGDYWVFAVRPGTPASNQVYPARYNSNTPQPPDGPRLWACPLALVDWQATPGVLDCRNHFDSLVVLTRRKLGGCCTVTVRPEDLSDKVTLQTIIDQYKSQDRINICLTPGVYPLNAPLVLGPEHSNLTLSGCHDGVFLQAQTGSEDAFLDGLVVVNRANNVSFKQIGFTLPQANFGNFGGLFTALETQNLQGQLGVFGQNLLMISIGIRALNSNFLAVENCLFQFSTAKGEIVWGAGVYGSSECTGLTIKSSRFLADNTLTRLQEYRVWQKVILSGFVLTPAYFQQSTRSTNSAVLPLLQDAYFGDNQFSGLTFATFIYSDAGALEFRRNTVKNCMAGFFYASLTTLAYAGDFSLVHNFATESTGRLIGPLQALGQNPGFFLGGAIARGLPLPKVFDTQNAIDITAQQPNTVSQQQIALLGQSVNQMLNSIVVKDVGVNTGVAANTLQQASAVPITTATLAATTPAATSTLAATAPLANTAAPATVAHTTTASMVSTLAATTPVATTTATPAVATVTPTATRTATPTAATVAPTVATTATPTAATVAPTVATTATSTAATLAATVAAQATAAPIATDPANLLYNTLLTTNTLALALINLQTHKLDLSLHFADNDIDTQNTTFNFAFVAVETEVSSNSSLIMIGNRLLNNTASMPTALAWGIHRNSITGNLIENLNTNEVASSISVYPQVTYQQTIGLAITGNVLQGTTFWPSRNLGISDTVLNSWDFLNTVI